MSSDSVSIIVKMELSHATIVISISFTPKFSGGMNFNQEKENIN